jgi:uncharacterized protein (TIGR00255 family)
VPALRSMTGFGQGRAAAEGLPEVRVSVRCTNHRHAEVQLRLPPELAEHEPLLRRRLREAVGRGRVELSVQLVRPMETATRLRVDSAWASRLLSDLRELQAELGLPGRLEIGDLLRLPGILQPEGGEAAAAGDPLPVLLEACERALAELERMRAEEGEALARDLRQRLEELTGQTSQLRSLAGEVSRLLLQRLRERVQEVNREIRLDEERLMQEVAFYADRGDITEEVVRLESHLLALREALDGGSPAGRRLEFLLQEAQREVNTAGSKVRTPRLSSLVIEMKTGLEKIREQSLNLE